MRPAFDEVLLLCPEVKTGGPEALHQLGYQIARHGGVARMVYYGPHSRHRGGRRHPALPCRGVADAGAFRAVPAAGAARDAAAPGHADGVSGAAVEAGGGRHKGYHRAVWWLSLDNAMPQNQDLLDQQARRGLFADASLIHFYQSDYARHFLASNGAAQYFPLSDYTDPQFIHRSLVTSEVIPIEARRDVVCFFPNKGGERAARFLAGAAALRHGSISCRSASMTKAQVRETLFAARIYLDFGHHPGKDRVPREAAIAGAVVLLHAAGAANCFPDHPLPAAYRFTEDDIASGALHRRIDAILDAPAAHFAAQRLYRQGILLEQERFDLEVRSFFFTGV